jgi:hypothetical protein
MKSEKKQPGKGRTRATGDPATAKKHHLVSRLLGAAL